MSISFNLRQASSSVPHILQNNNKEPSAQKENNFISLVAAQILCAQDVTPFLCHLREVDINWPVNDALKDSADKLYNYLMENPLSKNEAQCFSQNERFYLIGRTVNAQGYPHTNLFIDQGKNEAFNLALMAITTNHCQFIPPKTRFGAQWCLMQVAIQSDCLKLAMDIIDGFETPLSNLPLGSDVQKLLIGKSWDYLKKLNNGKEALAFVEQSTRLCGLHAINTPLIMAKFCQYQIEEHEENLISEFHLFLAKAQGMAEAVDLSVGDRNEYMRALIDLEDYSKELTG